MSFDKDYPNRKDRRKPYKGSKVFDRSCRNHGGCDYCKDTRTFKKRQVEEEMDIELENYLNGMDEED